MVKRNKRLKSRIIGILLILSALTPFVYTVFFLRSTSIFQGVLVDFIALVTLVITVIWYIRWEDSNKMKLIVGIGALGSIVLFVFSYKILIHTSDHVFFKIREKRLNKFSQEIKNYKKIYFLMNTQLGSEFINGFKVEYNDEKAYRSIKTGNRYLLSEMIKKENIDLERYRYFCKMLGELDLWSFNLNKDGSIFFKIKRDILLIYCQNGDELQLDLRTNTYRKVNHGWEKLNKNWYLLYRH